MRKLFQAWRCCLSGNLKKKNTNFGFPLAVFNIYLRIASYILLGQQLAVGYAYLCFQSSRDKLTSSVGVLLEWNSEKEKQLILTARHSNMLHVTKGIWWKLMSYSLTWFVEPILQKNLLQVPKLELFIYRYILVCYTGNCKNM